MKNLIFCVLTLIVCQLSWGQDEMAFGHESGNGGDRIREVFLWKGHEVVDYLSTSTDGLYLVDYYGLNVPELTRTLDINRLIVTNQILTDDTGSDVESLYDRATGILYLYKPTWLDLLNGAGISHTHILHEMCRMSSCNDDGYIISRHLQGKKVSDGISLVSGFMVDEGFSLLDEDYIIEAEYDGAGKLIYESFLHYGEDGQIKGKSRDKRKESEVFLETNLQKLSSGWSGVIDGTNIESTSFRSLGSGFVVNIRFELGISYDYKVRCIYKRPTADDSRKEIQVETCDPSNEDILDRILVVRVANQSRRDFVYGEFKRQKYEIRLHHTDPEKLKTGDNVRYQRDLGETISEPNGLIVRDRGEFNFEKLVVTDPELFVLLFINKYDFPRLPENGPDRPDEDDHWGNPNVIALPLHLQMDLGIAPLTFLGSGDYLVYTHPGAIWIAGWATPQAKLKVLEVAGMNLSVGGNANPMVILHKRNKESNEANPTAGLLSSYVLLGKDDLFGGRLSLEVGAARHFLFGGGEGTTEEILSDGSVVYTYPEKSLADEFKDAFGEWNGVLHLRGQSPLRDLELLSFAKGKHASQSGWDIYLYGPNAWGASLGISITPTWFGRKNKR